MKNTFIICTYLAAVGLVGCNSAQQQVYRKGTEKPPLVIERAVLAENTYVKVQLDKQKVRMTLPKGYEINAK
jgi:hypothetical protein